MALQKEVHVADHDKVCEGCGGAYVAHHARSRYCTDRCRGRVRRVKANGGKPLGPVTATVPSVVEQAPPAAEGSVYNSVLAALEAAGRVDTWKGAAALALASRADASQALMGYAPLIKELRSTMEDALAGAKVSMDPLDELMARRDKKTRASG